jgi:phage gp45-like
MIGIVTGHEVGKNLDGDKDVVLLQVQITEDEDTQTVELFSATGDDYIPPVGSDVIIAEIRPDWKVGIASKDNITSSVNTGERKLYSQSGDIIKAFINLLTTGIIELNGNSDFAVRFNALDTAIQTFITALNAALANKLDGSGTAGTLTLDISGAKIDEVKVI